MGLLLLGSCRRPDPLSDVVPRYLRLVLALSERDPDAMDFYAGPPELAAEVRQHPPRLAEIAAQADVLAADLEGLAQPDGTPEQKQRSEFLRGQLRAIAFRAGMLAGRHTSFDQESEALFGVLETRDTDADNRVKLRAAIASRIGAGANAYSTFEARYVVAPDRVPAVMSAALSACRTETLRHIPLPPGEHVDVEYVAHKPWSAFSRYLGNAHSLIQVNMDYPLTVDRILDLACHEGYPGHHVFNTLRDQAMVEQRHQAEWSTQLTFSPQSYLSEAAASYAPELAFPAEQHVAVERDLLFPAAGLNPKTAQAYVQVERLVGQLHTAEPAIARDYLDGRLEFVRAEDALEREALMEHAEPMLLYLNEYRSYMLCYTQGRDEVERYVTNGGADETLRWSRYLDLMRSPAPTQLLRR